MDSEFSGALYADPWQTFRTISEKMKKKTFKKPNFEEAAADYGSLSKKLEEENVPYAALALLKSAKCYGEQGSRDHEIVNYIKAARLFVSAEKDQYVLGLPTRWQYLYQSMYCYDNAIRIETAKENKQHVAMLHYELACELVKLDHHVDALEHFEQAAELFGNHLYGLTSSLRWLCCIATSSGEFGQAKASVRRLRQTLQPFSCDQASIWRSYLSDAEVATVLLQLAEPCVSEDMDPFELVVQKRYQAEPSMEEAFPPDGSSYLTNADVYISLRSFALAVRDNESHLAGNALTRLQRHIPVYLTDLGLIIIRATRA